ncbi:MAG: Smr/MutS family protein [Spirochaetota bacterium]
MDFGDILKAWEKDSARRDAQSGGVSRPAGPPPSGKKANPDRVSRAQGKPIKGKSGKGSGAEAGVPTTESIRQTQSAWLERYGVPEEARRDGDTPALGPPPKRDLARLPIDGTVDLHGMTVPDAIASLELFFSRAEALAWRKVLIVHGKGIHSKDGPILIDTVRRWLERRPSAGRSGPADAELGGGGATWVLLKGDQRSR